MGNTLSEKASRLPLKPGVYIMKDETENVIYVGKAVKLKNRVSSYFHGAHNAKTESMISKINDFDVIIANSELEALVLENSLIKHYMPKYNILLKDDKGYPYVRLDRKEEYPKFKLVSHPENDGAEYFGPFGGRVSTKLAIESICKALKLPTCSKKFPRDIGKERPCLNYHLGTCRAYCMRETDKAEYDRAIKEAAMIFQGKIGELVKKLQAEMEEAAEKLRFEQAAEIRDRIKAVSALTTRQHVVLVKNADTDAVGFCRGEVKSCFVVLHYIDGQLLGKDFEIIDTPMENDEEAISELVCRYYSSHAGVPKEILFPIKTDDIDSVSQMLTDVCEHRVNILVPQRGEKVQMIEAAARNAREEMELATTKLERIAKTAQWLQNALGLEKQPDRIEAYDISNTAGSDIVASMVVFFKGKPLKNAYRKFKINRDGQDDYACMAETIERRMQRFLDGDDKFKILPDVIFVDGGAAHTKVAANVLRNMKIAVPVFGMVKDDRHRTRALVSENGDEIGIAAMPSVFAFVGTIQEETHRFAVEYHHKTHEKNMRKSQLDDINGVGEKRKSDLMRAFKSISGIKNATIEGLCAVVPKNTAKSIYEYFHGESGE